VASTIEAEIIAALEAGVPEIAGRISPGFRLEGQVMPWVTYESSSTRQEGSVKVATRTAVELQVYADGWGTARELADAIAATARATVLANGERLTVGDSGTQSGAVDDGGGDAERVCSVEIVGWYHST
jgi:hypothetical protein